MLQKILKITIALLIFSFFIEPCRAEKREWLPLVKEELEMKECLQMPGASAIILFKEDYISQKDDFFKRYLRIKILTENGKDYANIEIPYVKEDYDTLTDLQARMIKPDGKIVNFNSQPLEKTVYKSRNITIMAKSITFPDVETGSIIEYSFCRKGYLASILEGIVDRLTSGSSEIIYEGGIPDYQDLTSLIGGFWIIQEDLFIKKARYIFEPFDDYIVTQIFGLGARLNWLYQNITGVKPQHQKDKSILLELENIKPFESEDYMPPPQNYIQMVTFIYGKKTTESTDVFWKEEAELWQTAVKNFMAGKKSAQSIAQQNLKGISNETEKLKKLYQYAQTIRNLSYENDAEAKKAKNKKTKDNTDIGDVLKRNYSYANEITRAFVALARAAGFEAYLARVVKRNNKLFQKGLMDFYEQFDSEIAIVKLQDRELFLDPGVKFCPFGLLHWAKSSTFGVRETSSGTPAYFATPDLKPEETEIKKEASLTIDENGTLKGTLKVTLSGQMALRERIYAYFEEDEKDRTEGWQNDIKNLLPSKAKVKFKNVENLEDISTPLILNFEIELPEYVVYSPKRVIIPAALLQENLFDFTRHAERKYAILFKYPYRETIEVKIKLPAQFQTETDLPQKDEFSRFASYKISTQLNNQEEIVLKRDFELSRAAFRKEEYRFLKMFAENIKKTDEAQIILKAVPNVKK